MKISSLLRSRRVLFAAGALAFGTAVNVMPGHAFAGYVMCRTDPIILLSNGHLLRVTASVSDTAADVTKITYTVHVPSGLGVSKITYTGGSFAGKEAVTVYANNPSGTYSTTTVVTTATAGVKAGIQTSVQGKSGAAVSATVTGISGQALTVQLKHT